MTNTTHQPHDSNLLLMLRLNMCSNMMTNIRTLQIFDQNDQKNFGAKPAGFDQHFFRH